MKFIFKVLILVFVCLGYVQANDYSYIKTITLAKDEHTKFLVKYEQSEKIFKFRWTLYANSGLVVLRSYDRIVGQHVLYKELKQSSFRVDLMPRGNDYRQVAYVLVKFVEYDFKTNKAMFTLFVSDKNSQVNLEPLEDK